ncbi:LamB/YcsF family protein [Solihabitans fulvus]|uniref:5-oxoprolinase subunit A n=1 Tax=Solihabitans fulvus TaxID=1892852 RepID=A0A5B2XJ90_9PSEU|nr:5-oxoprolinase subunit PxpA [Solihabitans fulvus]KAA2263483.1 LamB/YcsF family protein [Solihabitans fulvus]
MDLNADLGEGFGRWAMGDDEALLDVVTSANVACGFHAGDAETMLRTCRLAAARGVAVGAHVGYRDLAGFGRRFLDVEPATLTAEVLYQLGALDACARAAGTRVGYVKPHGALYNTIVRHEAQAEAVVAGVLLFDRELPVLGLPGAVWLDRAREAGLPVRHEAFADRNYLADGTLVPRSRPDAVLHDPAEVAARCVLMAVDGWVPAVDGEPVRVTPNSICVHGDSPGAVDMARAVRAALTEAGHEPRAFGRTAFGQTP